LATHGRQKLCDAGWGCGGVSSCLDLSPNPSPSEGEGNKKNNVESIFVFLLPTLLMKERRAGEERSRFVSKNKFSVTP
jgi:hypothetical protein